jgi:hypothetical protein
MQVLFVPSIGLDVSLLERLADSIDYPIKYLCVLNNGPVGALEGFRDSHPGWIVKEPATGNLGVAGGWNECVKLFPNEKSWLIVNEDAYFLPGQLEKICKCVDANLDAPIIYLNSSQAFYCFVWTAKGHADFGTFDENFFPAYLEDSDMRVRYKLAGLTSHVYALPDSPPVPHGKPRTGGINYTALIQGCGLLNRAYWLKKWGNFDFDNPLYKTPYKDHRLHPSLWVWMPEERAKRYPLWEAFINQPNPNIYE